MEPILKDISKIIEKHKNLDELFKNVDELLNYNLKNENFSIIDFYNSTSILAGEEFSRLLVFALRQFDDIDDFIRLENEGVDEELVNKLKFLISKYRTRFLQIINNESNPYAWKKINTKYIKQGTRQLIEMEVLLFNNKSFFIRDEPSEHIELFKEVFNEIKDLKSILDNEELDNVYTSLEELKELINDF
jgi:hypothetical protein